MADLAQGTRRGGLVLDQAIAQEIGKITISKVKGHTALGNAGQWKSLLRLSRGSERLSVVKVIEEALEQAALGLEEKERWREGNSAIPLLLE